MNRFDDHWNQNTNTIPEQKLVEAKTFLQPLLDFKNDTPMKILDAGCGDGVHIAAMRGLLNIKRPVAYDISYAALQLSQQQGQKTWEYVQGDVGALPFKVNSFDVAYSFGVLAYSTNPAFSFSELCRVIRPGGLVGVWLYPQMDGLGSKLFNLVRKLCQLTGPLGTRLIADSIVPLLGFLPTRSQLSLHNATWQQCREVVLVNIAPQQLYFPKLDEVTDWFEQNGLEIVYRDNANPITLWGRKL